MTGLDHEVDYHITGDGKISYPGLGPAPTATVKLTVPGASPTCTIVYGGATHTPEPNTEYEFQGITSYPVEFTYDCDYGDDLPTGNEVVLQVTGQNPEADTGNQADKKDTATVQSSPNGPKTKYNDCVHVMDQFSSNNVSEVTRVVVIVHTSDVTGFSQH